jgi:hypothetical protein
MRLSEARCVVTLVASCLAGPHVGAQTQQTEPAPPALVDIAAALSDARGITTSKPVPRRLPAPAGAPSYGFYEHLPGHQLLVTVNLAVVTEPQTVVQALEAIKAALAKQCAGKDLRFTETAPRIAKVVFGQRGDELMTSALAKLHDGGLLGLFDCVDAGGRLQSSTRVEWDKGERNPTEVIPPDQWRFRIESISVDRLERQSSRFEEYRRRTDTLRARPTAGAQVQLALDDLPPSVASTLPRPFNPLRHPFFVCALVTDARGSIAEVQIDQARFMVPAAKLLPGGTPVTSAELGVQLELKNPAYRTCLRP